MATMRSFLGTPNRISQRLKQIQGAGFSLSPIQRAAMGEKGTGVSKSSTPKFGSGSFSGGGSGSFGGSGGGGGGAGGMSAAQQKLIDQAKKAQDKSKQANLKRYQQILKGYRGREGDVMRDMEGLGDAERVGINRRGTQRRSNTQQDMASRGLSGTTIMPTALAGQDRVTEEQLGGLDERIRQQRSSAISRLRGDTLGFMERREDEGPNMGLLAQQMQAAGQGQGGYGAGAGGGVGGGSFGGGGFNVGSGGMQTMGGGVGGQQQTSGGWISPVDRGLAEHQRRDTASPLVGEEGKFWQSSQSAPSYLANAHRGTSEYMNQQQDFAGSVPFPTLANMTPGSSPDQYAQGQAAAEAKRRQLAGLPSGPPPVWRPSGQNV